MMAPCGGRAGRVRVEALASGRRGARPADAGHDPANAAAAGGMRAPGILAWMLYSGVLVTYAIGIVVWILSDRRESGAALDVIGDLAIYLPFATLGVVVARRRPEQRLGWLFLAIGLGGAARFMLLAAATTFDHDDAPAMAAVWVSSLVEWTALGALVAVLVLFPTGRPASRWSRCVLWVIGASVVFGWIDRTFPPGDRAIMAGVGNPFGFGALPSAVTSVVEGGLFLFPVGLLCAIVALSIRLARSRGKERQQLKVFVYAVVLSGTVFLLPSVVRVPLGTAWMDTPVGSTVRWSLLPVAAAVAIGVAILRHGLYDIDRIISRTVVYASVTAVLGLGYSGVVLLSGRLLGSDEEVPTWVVAFATLVAAAVFRPVRQAIQTRVERRFNRTRYDMHATIDEFNQRLRDNVDVAMLHDELIAVIEQTLQPTTAALWLAASATAQRQRAFGRFERSVSGHHGDDA